MNGESCQANKEDQPTLHFPPENDYLEWAEVIDASVSEFGRSILRPVRRKVGHYGVDGGSTFGFAAQTVINNSSDRLTTARNSD